MLLPWKFVVFQLLNESESEAVVNIGNYLSCTMWYNRFSYVIVVLCDYN